MTKIVFFGTAPFVLSILEALKKTKEIELVAVVTSPDRPVGRKQILTPSVVKKWALEHKIPVLTPERLDQKFQLEIGVLAAYGKIIPQEIINLFSKGILVIHPSLLPKYRGASPVQAAIINGDKETGVTIIKMDEKIDHGPIVAQFNEEIKLDDTAGTLYSRLFQKSAEVLVTILPAWVEGRIKPRNQDHSKATFTKILKKEDGYIDLEKPLSPEVFDRMVRAYHPWPNTWSYLPSRKIIKFLPQQKIQIEGGKPMTIKDFLNGYPEAKKWLLKLFSSATS